MTGPTRPYDHLSTEDLLEIAAGVVDGVLVRDLGMLASAAARPRTTVFGREAYPTLPDQAAALMHSLARNHPLVDGNKRLAWSATRVFCLLNGTDLVMDVDDAERMVLDVATGELEASELAEVISRHLR
ncbi:death-on-curing protein [Motilibacter peucedani]|uniref:Death-on-curing protein n=1 Tax=Motilibacter peucedani TaxID=598650 RepID=A0A420XUD2_9ACTN|nr:type II toxin-antitoxin system death-on-curing family toxin [Motilibacter peucedani]RKS80435.1 death-on-curing protein [Motilibacter peucedani]